jgi:hypothetical protein
MGLISRLTGRGSDRKSLDELDEETVNEAMAILNQEEDEVTKAELERQANHLVKIEDIDEGQFRMGVVQDEAEQEMSDRDIVAPNKIKEVSELLKDGYLVRGNEYVRILELHSFPEEVSVGWLDDLYSTNENIRVTQHIRPRDTGDMLQKLKKRFTQLRGKIVRKAKQNRDDTFEEERDRARVRQLIDDVISGETALFDVSVYIEVIAEDEEELDQMTEFVAESLGRLNAEMATLDKRQVEAQGAVAPVAKDPIKSRVLAQEGPAASMFPFIDRNIMNPEGVLYGFDTTQSPVMADRYDQLPSAGEVVAGEKGSGKTFSVIDHICKRRYIDTETTFLIADPMGDFSDFAEHVDGTVVHMGGDIKINPLEIHEAQRKQDRTDPFVANIRSVIGMADMGADEGLTQQQAGLFRRVLHLSYYKYGITQNSDTHRPPFPTFDDILDITHEIREGNRPAEFLDFHKDVNETEIRPLVESYEERFESTDNKVAADLYRALESFQQGGVNSNFNGRTNIELDSDIVVFDMSMFADSGEAPLFLHVMLDWIYQRTKVIDGKVHAIFDEVHYLLNREATQDLLDLYLRHIRHWDASLTLITQTVDEFLKEHNSVDNDKSSEIYRMCKIKRIFHHSQVSPEVAEHHNLSAAEQRFIEGAAQGEDNPYSESLFVVGSDIKQAISVEVDDYTRHLADESLDAWKYLIQHDLIQPKDVHYLARENNLHRYYDDIPEPVLSEAGIP